MQNTIYVTNVPLLTSEWDVAAHFEVAGQLRHNPKTGRPRVKLYADEQTGIFKGDAKVEYDDPMSAQRAVEMLNDKEFEGNALHVELATFAPQGAGSNAATKNATSSKARGGDGDDWQCSMCRHVNPNGRGSCKRCGATNKRAGGGNEMASNAGGDKWVCPGCKSANAQRRTACALCHHPKPGT